MHPDLIAIVVLAILVVACEDRPATTTAPPPDPRPLAVRIEGPTQLTPPAEAQFTAVQTWSDGSTRDVTASAQWISTNPAVLSISAGLAKALATGQVGLTAQVAPFTSQPRAVHVVPSKPEWDGRYTLRIGGGPCNSTSLPLPPELRERTYSADVRQFSLGLNVDVANVGYFDGQIFNPQVRFNFTSLFTLGRRGGIASARGTVPGAIRLVSSRRSAYPAGPRGFVEKFENTNRLVIIGEAITTMSPSGFTGTLNGALTLYELSRGGVLGVCSSSSHGFTLVRN